MALKQHILSLVSELKTAGSRTTIVSDNAMQPTAGLMKTCRQEILSLSTSNEIPPSWCPKRPNKALSRKLSSQSSEEGGQSRRTLSRKSSTGSYQDRQHHSASSSKSLLQPPLQRQECRWGASGSPPTSRRIGRDGKTISSLFSMPSIPRREYEVTLPFSQLPYESSPSKGDAKIKTKKKSLSSRAA
jgi:hypothetical protein